MTLPKLPTTPSGWASLLLGLGLALCGCAHWLQGDFAQASLEFAGAAGTLGLPSLVGSGYHVEVRRDEPIDLQPPPGYP